MGRVVAGIFLFCVSNLILLCHGCKEIDSYRINSVLQSRPSSISLTNYLGNNQNIHPKVLFFENKWNGYQFWMSYTPYPYGETDAENPCIAVSNDGKEWNAPEGLRNPLAFAPENGYNSDTHLLFNSETNLLECWWREAYEDIREDRIVRSVSKNGVQWSDPEEMLYEKGKKLHLSPSVLIMNGYYTMFYCDGRDIIMVKSETRAPDIKWGAGSILKIDWNGIIPWHLDVINEKKDTIEMVICGYTEGNDNNSADLYYLFFNFDSQEGSRPEIIIRRSVFPGDLHSRSLYRSSLLRINNMNYVFFSGIDLKWRRSISLAFGEDIHQLKFHSLDTSLIE